MDHIPHGGYVNGLGGYDDFLKEIPADVAGIFFTWLWC
jgi:hypothetical protein